MRHTGAFPILILYTELDPDTCRFQPVTNSAPTRSWRPSAPGHLTGARSSTCRTTNCTGSKSTVAPPRSWDPWGSMGALTSTPPAWPPGAAAWDLAPDGKHAIMRPPVESVEAPKQDHEIVMLMSF